MMDYARPVWRSAARSHVQKLLNNARQMHWRVTGHVFNFPYRKSRYSSLHTSR
jgi:hypothetical protein